MEDNVWIELEGIDPSTTEFPVAAKAGDDRVVIYKAGEKYHGVGRFCAHRRADLLKTGMPMSNGSLLRCNLHGYVYRMESGKCVNAPGEDIGGYEVTVEGNHMRVRKTHEGVKGSGASRLDTAKDAAG